MLDLLRLLTEGVIVAHDGLALLCIIPPALLTAKRRSRVDPWAIAGARVLGTAIGFGVELLVPIADRAIGRWTAGWPAPAPRRDLDEDRRAPLVAARLPQPEGVD